MEPQEGPKSNAYARPMTRGQIRDAKDGLKRMHAKGSAKSKRFGDEIAKKEIASGSPVIITRNSTSKLVKGSVGRVIGITDANTLLVHERLGPAVDGSGLCKIHFPCRVEVSPLSVRKLK
jgi:hypothetical protein